jgi:hypothetical protein
MTHGNDLQPVRDVPKDYPIVSRSEPTASVPFTLEGLDVSRAGPAYSGDCFQDS